MSRYDDEYDSIYNAMDDWADSAYDEDGNSACCDVCGAELRYRDGYFFCPECGRQLTKAEYLDYIGAMPPGPACVTCRENYPFCKKFCDVYEIDPNDPIL